MELQALMQNMFQFVNIVGLPSTDIHNHHALVHHTLGDGRFNVFINMQKENHRRPYRFDKRKMRELKYRSRGTSKAVGLKKDRSI